MDCIVTSLEPGKQMALSFTMFTYCKVLLSANGRLNAQAEEQNLSFSFQCGMCRVVN